jgi:hypothetical protein
MIHKWDRHKSIYLLIQFTQLPENIKIQGNKSFLVMGQEKGTDYKRRWKCFCEWKNCFIFDGYMIHKSQNTSNCTCYRVNFTVYKLKLNKTNLQKVCRLLKAFNTYCQVVFPLTYFVFLFNLQPTGILYL